MRRIALSHFIDRFCLYFTRTNAARFCPLSKTFHMLMPAILQRRTYGTALIMVVLILIGLVQIGLTTFTLPEYTSALASCCSDFLRSIVSYIILI